jgi:hypothetical protein
MAPYADNDEPKRKNERTLIALPMCRKSNTDSPDPIRTIPYALMLDPERTNERIEQALPKEQKSKTESDDPRLVNP